MSRKPKKSEEVKAETPEADVVPVIEATPAIAEDLSAESLSPALDEPAVENDSQAPQSLCGGVLRATREEQGLSVKDVAQQLRLGNKQIEALEQDNFSSLPEATIVKGFIRNYAKVLKISAEPLLAAYAEMMPEKERYSFTLNPGINMKITENRKSNTTRYFLLTIGLLLGVGVWFFYQSYVQKPNPINTMPEVSDVLPELALPMSERTEDVAQTQLEMPEPSVTEPAVESSMPDEPVMAVGDNKQLEEVASDTDAEISDEAVVDVAQPTSPEVGKTRLAFSATQETWLSVVNANGKEVYNKILYAGNRDVVDVWQPSEIVVGNAHGATLMIDGKPIDLAPYTRINVARVRLNQ
jgi:cytoskeleton protein RodZ